MKHALMLIESPNKIKSISKYLSGTDIDICATNGHIRELDSKSFNSLGFDPETYEMKWKNESMRVVKGKPPYDVIKEINSRANNVEKIYLSTDPDREGEAIAWHIYEILSPDNKKKCKRVVFNEITKQAITKALEDPRDLDQGQIESYWARKLLDRGLGFKLSDFARRSIGGASAGRVQSIALKFLKDKYDEIASFVPDHWFNLETVLKNGLSITLKELSSKFNFDLKNCGTGLINFSSQKDADACLSDLKDTFILMSIGDPKEDRQNPPKPFKTSTMQTSAINKLHMSAYSIDRLAQNLYEGVDIQGEDGIESVALITYPRTDREDLSDSFVQSASKWIIDSLGKKYLNERKKAKTEKAKTNLVQGAHEAIRPVDVCITPQSLKGKVSDERLIKLYSLIWTNAVASLMQPSINNNVLYIFDNNGHKFTANNRIEIFDGFKKLAREFSYDKPEIENDFFPELIINNEYETLTKDIRRVDKKPPSPYTESTLIKALEKEGIGRPSTYSSIVGIVQTREYAVKDGNKLNITNLGIDMSKELEKYFPNIMKYDYTRNMELELDNISERKSNWKEFLTSSFEGFNKELQLALEKVQNAYVGTCPECGGDLKNKYSHKTKRKLVGCENYPQCKYIYRPDPIGEEIGENCPQCSKALLKVIGRYNKPYIRCSSVLCKFYKSWQDGTNNEKTEPELVGKKCPKCGKELVKRIGSKWKKSFVGCTGYPKCKYIDKSEVSESNEKNQKTK